MKKHNNKVDMTNNESKLNIFLSQTNLKPVSSPINKNLIKEKTSVLVKTLLEKLKNNFISTFKRIFNPILTKGNETSAFLKAQSSSISGNEHSEVYQLLNMLSNKKHYISVKASFKLETIIFNDENRKIINNYFKFNPEAQVKFKKLYSLVSRIENSKSE